MNRSPIITANLLLAALALIQGECRAAAGDVSFQAANKTVQLNPGNLATSIDVFFHVAGSANVPATGWGMTVQIAPQAGATGTVLFNPPTIVADQPNLMPASQTPFIDFDRDFGGKSYGTLGQTNSQLNAFSHYYSPALGPPPPLDSNGNLTLPDGKGLVALPLLASFDASGQFNVSFDADPVVTGVIYATGMPAPNDVGVHPAGTHVTGVLTLINLRGDYNRNGKVDAADYTVWRNTLGSPTNHAADGNGNNVIDFGDYTVWKTHYGQSAGSGAGAIAWTHDVNVVPEPASALLSLIAAAGVLRRCRLRGRRLLPTH